MGFLLVVERRSRAFSETSPRQALFCLISRRKAASKPSGFAKTPARRQQTACLPLLRRFPAQVALADLVSAPLAWPRSVRPSPYRVGQNLPNTLPDALLGCGSPARQRLLFPDRPAAKSAVAAPRA